MTVLFMLTACVQEESQSHATLVPNDDVALSSRGDCDECPGANECCCAIWFQPLFSGNFNLVFCGTSNGGNLCSGAATGMCSSFSGGGLTLSLSLTETWKPFCMDEDAPFYIYNSNPSDTAELVVSCQIDLTPPDTLWIKIPPLEYVYIYNNSSCELGPC